MLEASLGGVALGGSLATAFGTFRSKTKRELIDLQGKLLDTRALENSDLERRIVALEAKVGVLEDGFADRIAEKVVKGLEALRVWG